MDIELAYTCRPPQACIHNPIAPACHIKWVGCALEVKSSLQKRDQHAARLAWQMELFWQINGNWSFSAETYSTMNRTATVLLKES